MFARLPGGPDSLFVVEHWINKGGDRSSHLLSGMDKLVSTMWLDICQRPAALFSLLDRLDN